MNVCNCKVCVCPNRPYLSSMRGTCLDCKRGHHPGPLVTQSGSDAAGSQVESSTSKPKREGRTAKDTLTEWQALLNGYDGWDSIVVPMGLALEVLPALIAMKEAEGLLQGISQEQWAEIAAEQGATLRVRPGVK